MPSKIVLLGKAEKHFHFLTESLRNLHYQFDFLSVDSLPQEPLPFNEVDLFIIDTLPLPEEVFQQIFTILKENPQFRGVPVLALVPEKPIRLRYRLVDMGVDDYLLVPFDRLDARMRVQNLLKISNPIPEPAGEPSAPLSSDSGTVIRSSSDTIEELTELYRIIHKAVLSGEETGKTIDLLVKKITELSDAQFALLFDVEKGENLILQQKYPGGDDLQSLSLPVADLPILLKAVRMQKPTTLNRITPGNPLIGRLNKHLPGLVKSIIVYPLPVQEVVKSVLMVIKSDDTPFTEYHYALVEHISHLLSNFYYLKALEKNVNDQMDSQIWKFYFEFLDQVMNQLDFGILVIGDEHHIKYINVSAAKLLRVTPREAVYKPVTDAIDETILENILNTADIPATTIDRPEIEFELPDGTKKLIGFTVHRFSGKMKQEDGYIIVLKDITDIKDLQEEMRRVDRLASLGMMASGIAHEIRNPLAGIKAMAQTFEEELSEDDPRNEYVRRIVRLVNRLDDLLRTLFSYARPSKPNRQFCDIPTIVKEVYSLIHRKLKENNIKLSIHIQPQLPEVFMDPAQLQQVLINLLLNSIEAIHEEGQIDIDIHLFYPKDHAQHAPAVHARYYSLLKPEPHLKIHIKDNGCGIARENLEHIFNPFYTTKPYGTGLGLSIVYQIVKENDGIIYYESEPNRGTDCYLYLPINKMRPSNLLG